MNRLLLLFLLIATPAAAQRAAVQSVSVEGTEFVVTMEGGSVLRSKDLQGSTMNVRLAGEPMRIRIAAVEADPDDRSGTVWLHTVEALQNDGRWANLCSAGPDGRQQGFPFWGPKGLELTCSSGAIGKCVRFGFRPWAFGTDGRSLAAQHAACVHMVRGDYGGDGDAWTRNGMRIDLYDTQGLQKPDLDPAQAFEAGWSAEGAVCVHHVRVKENTTLAALEHRYPRLRGRTGAICTEAFARANGALLFNRSDE